jgi:PAS domain S-box-containing protein
MGELLRALILGESSRGLVSIEELLRQSGFVPEARWVCAADEMRAAFNENTWDVVLSDQYLGATGAAAALDLVRRLNIDVPIVIVSDPADGDQVVEALRAGVQDHVFTDHLERLGPVIQRALREAGERRARREAEQALRESEARYRSFFEESRDAAFISTVDGRLLDINAAGVQLFGYESKAELLRADLVRDFYVHPADRGETVRQLIAQGFVADRELRLRDKQGQKLTVLETATAVRNEAGEVVAVRGLLRDVTAQRELEDQLRQAQKMEAVGTLASGVAHDFSNSLTAILGYTDLARGSLPANHSALESLRMIEQAARQAAGVTKSLLTFARKAVCERAPVNLGRALPEWIKLLRRILPASIEVVEEVHPEHAAWVQADPIQIQQALMNLVVNARDAMPEGGLLRISLSTGPGDSPDSERNAILVVEDTGVGMSETLQTRIFEPFFTTKARGRGTGLGMSVIHGIITGHQGTIAVESEPSQGTRVMVTIPCCDPPGEAADSAPQRQDRAGEGELVLVVEDDEHIRSIMVSALRTAGYDVVAASDGEEAVATLAKYRQELQLVVLDLDLPKKSGLAWLQETRDARRNLPTIAVTGAPEFNLGGLFGGNELLLRKPFQMSELIALIGRTLAKDTTARKRA